MLDSGWAGGATPAETGQQIEEVVHKHAAGDPATVAVGIDSPSRPLAEPRAWFWNGRQKNWRRRKGTQRGWGRHSEIVVCALGLAKPQWTPFEHEAPEWMRVGFAIFKALGEYPRVYEVFPSASYSVLKDVPEARISIEFSEFVSGPKDMLDACVGALTVREYSLGRGMKVGNGDGLGAIVLPRKVGGQPPHPVLAWPE